MLYLKIVYGLKRCLILESRDFFFLTMSKTRDLSEDKFSVIEVSCKCLYDFRNHNVTMARKYILTLVSTTTNFLSKCVTIFFKKNHFFFFLM